MLQCNAMQWIIIKNQYEKWYLHFLAHNLLVGPVILMQYFQTKLLLPAQHKGVLIYLWQHNEHWHCMQWQIKTDMQICGTGGNNQCYHFRSWWYTRNHHILSEWETWTTILTPRSTTLKLLLRTTMMTMTMSTTRGRLCPYGSLKVGGVIVQVFRRLWWVLNIYYIIF